MVGRERIAVVLALVAVVFQPVRAAAASGDGPVTLLAPAFVGDLRGAFVGGKHVCGAAIDDDGRDATAYVVLPGSSRGPDRTGLYRRDITSGEQRLVRAYSDWVPRCGITSGDGGAYAYFDPLVYGTGIRAPIEIVDTTTGSIEVIAVPAGPLGGSVTNFPLQFSADHRYLFFGADASALGQLHSGATQLVRYDTTTRTFTLAAPAPDGSATTSPVATDYSISADGQRVFYRYRSGPSSVVALVHDLRDGRVISIARRDGQPAGDAGMISADGSTVAIASTGYPLTTNPFRPWTQVEVVDIDTGAATLVSGTPDGRPADHDCQLSDLSDDGHVVVFESHADNIVPGFGTLPTTVAPIGPSRQLFVRDVDAGVTRAITRRQGTSAAASGGSGDATIDGAARHVVFASNSSDLVDPAGVSRLGIYVYDTMLDSVAELGPAPEQSSPPVIARHGGVVLYTQYDRFIESPMPYVAKLSDDEPPPLVPEAPWPAALSVAGIVALGVAVIATRFQHSPRR